MMMRTLSTLILVGSCVWLTFACQTRMAASSSPLRTPVPYMGQFVQQSLTFDLQAPSGPAQPELFLKQHPGDKQAIKALAFKALREARLAQASLLTDMLLRQDPKDPMALNLMGLILWQKSHSLEDDRRALTYFLLAVESGPQLAAARLNLGLMNLRLGQIEAAQKEFTKVKNLCPACSTAWLGTALVAYQQGLFELAQRDIEQALLLRPEDKQAQVLKEALSNKNPQVAVTTDPKQ